MGVTLLSRDLDPSSPAHNRLQVDDQAVHRWYRFVLSFPAHLVREYAERFSLGEGSNLLDPFCGTGTTLVEAKKLGLNGVGVEASPMAAFASRVKIDWSVSPQQLRNAADEVFAQVTRRFEGEGIPFGEVRSLCERRSLFDLLDLNQAASSLLLKGSICPLPLHRSLTLLNTIHATQSEGRDHLLLALAWTLVNRAGNLRFGPEVGVTPPKHDVDVVAHWRDQVERIAADLEEWGPHSQAVSRLIHDDSREMDRLLEPASVDAVITSPPYPNEKDYTRTTRLESVVLGLIRTPEELRRVKKGLVRSNTRSVYVEDMDDVEVAHLASVQDVARRIEARRLELGKTSGFERLYHRVTKLYFGGMRRHLILLQPVLRPGARLAYVVGDQASYLRVMIRTGQLVAEIAETCGYQVESIDLFRTRLATATREQLREEVVVLRWDGRR